MTAGSRLFVFVDDPPKNKKSLGNTNQSDTGSDTGFIFKYSLNKNGLVDSHKKSNE